MRWPLSFDWLTRRNRLPTVSTETAGLHADGVRDDGPALRKLLTKYSRLVLPPGHYLVCSTFRQPAVQVNARDHLAAAYDGQVHLHVQLVDDTGFKVPHRKQHSHEVLPGVVLHTRHYV